MGDEKDGFSLYLLGGIRAWPSGRRASCARWQPRTRSTLDQWAHVAGVVDAKGELSLLVDTWPVARAEGSLLGGASPEPLAVGADPGSPVGGYTSALHWQGLLQDVRVYRGVVSRDTDRDILGEWAQRPGCGCRK